MVSVGIIATLVNLFIIIVVTFVDRAIESVVRNFALSRLRRENHAPVVHDSDTWLPNFPRSIIKFRRHPAILLTVLCGVFLIASELVSEGGVDVSQKCAPAKKKGIVITPGDSKARMSTVELGAGAFLMQTIVFIDKNLTFVPSGLPKRITGSECLRCLKERGNPDIMRGCRVSSENRFPAGKLRIGVKTTTGPFKTIAEAFQEIGGKKRMFSGLGDLTGNGFRRAVFMFSTLQNSSKKAITYLEYGNQNHSQKLLSLAGEQAGQVVWEINQSEVHQWDIECDVNELSIDHFLQTMMVFRTIQLENPSTPAVFVEEEHRFSLISDQDVYRAGISIKITDEDNKISDYYIYTSCGIYHWIYLAPFITCLSLVLVLSLVSWHLSRSAQEIDIPYSSESWYSYVQKQKASKQQDKIKPTSSYFGSLSQEMVLVTSEESQNCSLSFRSKQDR